MSASAEDIRPTVIAGTIGLAFVATIMFIFDVPISQDQFTFFFTLFAVIVALSQLSRDLSIGFILITIGVAMIVAEYIVPGFIADPIGGAMEAILLFLGIDPGPIFQIPPIPYTVVAIIFVFFMIAIRLRATGEKKFIRPLLDRTLREMGQIFEVYAQALRLAALFVFLLIVVLLEQGALFAGELGSQAAEAPFIVTNAVTGLIGYLSISGDLTATVRIPLIGIVDEGGLFAFVVILLLGIAAAIKYEAGGPLAQFLRE